MNSYQYRGFKLEIDSVDGEMRPYYYVIYFPNGDVLDSSNTIFRTEEDAIKDAKYAIDRNLEKRSSK